MSDIQDNASDMSQIRKAKKRDRLRDKQWHDDVRAVMATPEGRRVMYAVIEDCGMYRLSYCESSHHTAFCEGGRNIGINLTGHLLRICPKLYGQMLDDANKSDEPEV